MIRKAPASDAVAIDMPKAMRLIRVGSTAISRSASGSCDTAMTARPMKLRDRKICRPTNMTSDTRHGTSRRSGNSIAPRLTLAPI